LAIDVRETLDATIPNRWIGRDQSHGPLDHQTLLRCICFCGVT
jgi:hypothetical protein